MTAMEELWLNRFGHTRSDVNADMLGGIRANTVLDIGCGCGVNLELLEKDGFLFEGGDGSCGVDANRSAIAMAKEKLPQVNWLRQPVTLEWTMDAKPKQFDVVMFSGALMHLPQPTMEVLISRVMKWGKFIYIAEYWAPNTTEVVYRGHERMMWRRPHARLFTMFGCTVIKQARLRHLDDAERLYTEVALLECP